MGFPSSAGRCALASAGTDIRVRERSYRHPRCATVCEAPGPPRSWDIQVLLECPALRRLTSRRDRPPLSGSRSLALAQLPVQVPSGLRAVALGPHSSRLWGTSRATTGLQRAWLGVAHAALQVLLSGQSAPRWVESRPSPSFV